MLHRHSGGLKDWDRAKAVEGKLQKHSIGLKNESMQQKKSKEEKKIVSQHSCQSLRARISKNDIWSKVTKHWTPGLVNHIQAYRTRSASRKLF